MAANLLHLHRFFNENFILRVQHVLFLRSDSKKYHVKPSWHHQTIK